MATATCPYCAAELEKVPQRKSKCPICGQPIYVKATPEDRQKRLMTESQAADAEARWERRSIIQHALGIASSLGFDAKSVERDLAAAADVSKAIENLCLDAATNGKDRYVRRLACFQLAIINAAQGSDSFLLFLEQTRVHELAELKDRGIRRVEVRPGDLSKEICRRARARSAMDIDEALRSPPIPNPMCPRGMGKIERGFCICYFEASRDNPW